MKEIERVPAIDQWLKYGWQTFKKTKQISVLISSFIFIATAIFFTLAIMLDGMFILYPFIAGFFLVGPLVIMGYQRVAHRLHSGVTPTISDFFKSDSSKTSGIWFLTFILSFCFFIWITDAFVIYGLYFGIEVIEMNAQLLSDPSSRESVFYYLFYSGLMGFVTAIIGFTISVLSIPLMLHKGMDFVSAVHLSIKCVFSNKWLMAKWALFLVVSISVTLIVALPLIIVLFPVLGFASYALYLDLGPS